MNLSSRVAGGAPHEMGVLSGAPLLWVVAGAQESGFGRKFEGPLSC